MPRPRITSREFLSSDIDDESDTGARAPSFTQVHSDSDVDELDDESSNTGGTLSVDDQEDEEAPPTGLDAMADHILLQSLPKKKTATKRKNGTKSLGTRKSAAKKAQQSNEDLREGRKATYNISIFLASEKEKDLKKRAGSNTFMKLAFGEPFDTWKAQLLVRIDKAVKPDKLDINDYELLFTVARTSPAPMAVTSEDEYDDMLERIAKNKDLTCSLYVQALHPKREKENNREGSAPLDEEDEPAKKKAKKTKAPKPTDINTANIPHNDNIKALRERWLCHKKPGCSNEHCFINPVDVSHFPLGHAHFDVWAAAMLKGPDVASLTTPPNHHLFSAVAGNQLGQLSPLIERQNRMKNNNGPSTFQLSLSPEVIQLFGKTPAPQTPPAAPPALAAPAPIVQPPPIDDEAPLIPRNRLSGPEMPLDQFCAMYHLTDRVRNKLDECGYSGTHTFPYSKWKDLVGEAGLKAGEIAQLKHALFQWTIPTE